MSEILIIDDDRTTCLLLKRNLERQGYTIHTSEDGAQGLALAQNTRPALIICDWQMPHMDGLEVCRAIKSQPQFSTTFFILLTARTEVEDRVQGLDAGADEFLSKPIDPNELQARVRAGLRLHQVNEDLLQQTRFMQEEMAKAAAYVRSLLPPPQHFSISKHQKDHIAMDWLFVPSQELGGDSFNYNWLDPTHLAIYLLDVSGHGIGAALLSVSLMNLLRSQTLLGVDPRQPDQVLKALNNGFQMSAQNELYFTIWYGVYDTQNRTLTYSSGGHPPALLILHPNGPTITPEVLKLKTPNVPIGMAPDIDFNSATCELKGGADLYLFSDGCYEVFNPAGEIWGLDALVTALSRVTQGSLLGRKTQLDNLIKALQKHSGQPLLEDDCSLLRVSFDPVTAPPVTVPSPPQRSGQLGAFPQLWS